MIFLIYFRLGPCDLPLPDQWIAHTQLSQHSTTSTISLSLSSPIGGNLLLQDQQQQHHHQQQQQQQPILHHQSQPKIMNAVAPAVACPPAAAKNKRRKPDNKVSVLIFI